MSLWGSGSPRPGVGGLLRVLVLGIGTVGLLLARRGVRQARPGGAAAPAQRRGQGRMRLLGNLLLMAGAVALLLAGVTYAVDHSQRVLPGPVALSGSSGPAALTVPIPPQEGSPTSTGTPEAAVAATEVAHGQAVTPLAVAAGEPTVTATPTATAVPTVTPTPTATAILLKPGVPIRVVIPSIEVDSRVQEAGTYWEKGQLVWQTLPFLVAHYRVTAKAGEKGNAVFSGHVTSRDAGNVFRDLYKIQYGDEVHVYTQDARFTYVVTGIREVLPTETSVMDPTPDATATLITCSGEWIPARREYSHRLIVTAKLKG